MQPFQSIAHGPTSAAFSPSIHAHGAAPAGPLTGEWRHGQGYIICGTMRIARLDFDTSPSAEFRAELLDWVCDRLNAATEAARAVEEANAHTAAALEGLVCALAQFDDCEPGPGDGLASDPEDARQHGQWMRRRERRRALAQKLLDNPWPGKELLTELRALRQRAAADFGAPVRIADRSPAEDDEDCEGHVFVWVPGEAGRGGLPAVPGGWELRPREDLEGGTHWCRTGQTRPLPILEEAA